MSHSTTILWWIGINVALGVFGPLAIGKAAVWLLTSPPKVTIRQFYSKGELGLVSLVTGLSVIFDVNKAQHFPASLRNYSTVTLLIGCGIAAWIWAVPLIFDLAKVKTVNWKRVWHASWQIAALVFTLGLVTEIFLELLSEAGHG